MESRSWVEVISDKSQKFWKAKFQDEMVLINYGKIGKNKPNLRQKNFNSEKDAEMFVQNSLTKKLKSGYQ